MVIVEVEVEVQAAERGTRSGELGDDAVLGNVQSVREEENDGIDEDARKGQSRVGFDDSDATQDARA